MSTLLTVESLSKTFGCPTPTTLFKDISFNLNHKQSLSICGNSGEGKSTLLHILAGFEPSTSGNIIYEQSNLSEMNINEFRRSLIGFVFQSFNLLEDLSVLENVLLPAQLAGTPSTNTLARAKELIGKVGLSHRIDHPANLLSGGEKQRTAIARALINQPKLILADEPTGNLDQTTSEQIQDLLFDLIETESISLILVTHDTHLASRCDKQINLSQLKLGI